MAEIATGFGKVVLVWKMLTVFSFVRIDLIIFLIYYVSYIYKVSDFCVKVFQLKKEPLVAFKKKAKSADSQRFCICICIVIGKEKVQSCHLYHSSTLLHN